MARRLGNAETGVPENHQSQFVESIWYLPDTRFCFSVPQDMPPVSRLPALSKGLITFGCFQNLAKIGEEVLETWREIFAQLPRSRLRIQCAQLSDETQIKNLRQRLEHHGISPERVELYGWALRKDYLMAYSEIDLILDTFPYSGGTTTCEALLMGVPTITLSGDSLLARQGASLLTAAGLEELVAQNKANYIAKAVMLSGDIPRLEALRIRLRQQTLESPLCNAPRFAKNFEEAMWEMWESYRNK